MNLDINRILESRRVPTLPAAAVKVLQLLGSAEPDREAIANTIKADPGISAKIIQVSNSSFYGLRSEVVSIEHAVSLLGPATLASICLTVSLNRFSFKGQAAEECFRTIWEQSLLRASAAETIGRLQVASDPGVLFIQALLCDLGSLAILAVHPAEYLEVFHGAADTTLGIVEFENKIMDVDHVSIGAELASRWGLPDIFVSAIKHHHDSVEELLEIADETEVRTNSIVAMSSLIAELIQTGEVAAHHEQIIAIGERCLGMDEEAPTKIFLDVQQRAVLLPSEFGLDVARIPSPDEITELAAALLASICSQVDANATSAMVSNVLLRVENETLQETCKLLRVQANIDNLTQLYNRGFIDFYLSELVTNHVGRDDLVGVIVCDIDQFKSLNDRLGHDTGDGVLKAVSSRIVEAISDGDVVARYGGEEFVIVVRRQHIDEVRDLATLICNRVRESSIRVGEAKTGVTVSAGFATTEDFSSSGAGLQLLKEAGKALCKAKESGKNCVCEWQGDDASTRVETHAPMGAGHRSLLSDRNVSVR